jgi:hypothetical protein
MIQPPSSQPHTDSIPWALPFCQMEWGLIPPAVQDYILLWSNVYGHLEKSDIMKIGGAG